jgi:hypothetical protein
VKDDPILAAIQQLVDTEWPGWHVGSFTVVVGLEQVDSTGDVSHEIDVYKMLNQAPWTTSSLLEWGKEKYDASVTESPGDE